MFLETFTAVQANFRKVFQTLFGGGECELRLANPDDPLESEIEIHAAPRGKRTQRIHLLSSGERTLVAVSLLFSIYLTKPSPFCLMDEVDAPLDDANVGRFTRLLDEFKTDTQFLVITHNPRTMQAADAVYGVTMQEPGVSTIVGVRLGERSTSRSSGWPVRESIASAQPADADRHAPRRATRTRSGGSSRPSRRWATRRGRCRASSAPPSASSATTAGSTGRASPRCPACRRSSTSPSRTSRSRASGSRSPPSCGCPAASRSAATTSWSWRDPARSRASARSSTAARAVREAGATVLRAGAFKPRSSPYSFQGLGEAGPRAAGPGARGDRPAHRDRGDGRRGARPGGRGGRHHPDRRAQHAELLAAQARRAAAASRCCSSAGIAATIKELLLSAEYILAEGNPHVILCERGIRGFDPATRNLFDLSAIPVVHGLSHLPIIADPSHGTGHRDMVTPMARAAVAAGADGLLVEVHPNPDRALSDGAQSLYPEQFERMMKEVRLIAEAIGRRVAEPVGAARVSGRLLLLLALAGAPARVRRRRTPPRSSAARRGCIARSAACGPTSSRSSRTR